MAKSTGTKCPVCGEVQFTILTSKDTGLERDVILCDSCSSKFWKPADFHDENGLPE